MTDRKLNPLELPEGDERYYDEPRHASGRNFDAQLLRQPVSTLPVRVPLMFAAKDSATDAMRAMQAEHRGCILVSEDGTAGSRLVGIFTERDVLLKIIDGGRNPTTLTLGEVMTSEPEAIPSDASVAWVLNKMVVGGFRHVPVVDQNGRVTSVVSVRDIVRFLVEAFPEEVLNLPPEFGGSRFETRDGA